MSLFDNEIMRWVSWGEGNSATKGLPAGDPHPLVPDELLQMTEGLRSSSLLGGLVIEGL